MARESALGSNLVDEPLTVQKAPRAKAATPETLKIVLEEGDQIPPTGLFVGLNGRGYLLRAGEEAEVPIGVVDVLDHAIMSTAQVDPSTGQVLGYRDRSRYPYRVVR